ncbi:TIGR03943 family putative permease subunit [Streptomyces sp. NPDC054863]
MRRAVQPLLLLLTGAALLRVSLFSDICLRYVKEGLQPFLVVTGLVLTCLGLVGTVRDVVPLLRGRGDEEEHAEEEESEASDGGPASQDGAYGHDHGHDHSRGPRVAWLLLPPALLLLLLAPPALGSYMASRDNPQLVADYERFDPLPAEGRPVPLSLTEFIARLQQDESGNLTGRTLVLQGFVTPAADSGKCDGKCDDKKAAGAWELTRLVVSCCAADSLSLNVPVHGVPAPPADSWVKVTGTWRPGGTPGTTSASLALDVTTIERIPEPASPYMDRAPGL